MHTTQAKAAAREDTVTSLLQRNPLARPGKRVEALVSHPGLGSAAAAATTSRRHHHLSNTPPPPLIPAARRHPLDLDGTSLPTPPDAATTTQPRRQLPPHKIPSAWIWTATATTDADDDAAAARPSAWATRRRRCLRAALAPPRVPAQIQARWRWIPASTLAPCSRRPVSRCPNRCTRAREKRSLVAAIFAAGRLCQRLLWRR